MKIYGYELDSSDLVSLDEMTIQASVTELEQLVYFLKNTINLIKDNPIDFGHEHFNDYLNTENRPDIIIMNDNKKLEGSI